MLLAVLAVVALAWWLHGQGLLVPNLVRLGGTAAAGLIAFRLLTTGRVVPALVAAAVAWGWWQYQGRQRRRRTPPAEIVAAARLLGVAPGAPAEEVWQAWRQAMARAHPDAGGSAEEAQRLTAARDLLIAATGDMAARKR